MNIFHKLTPGPLANIKLIDRPERDVTLDLNSSAKGVFTDFTEWTQLMMEQNTPIQEAIDLQALAFARIGDVLATTESFSEQHVLVIDHDRKSGRSIGP